MSVEAMSQKISQAFVEVLQPLQAAILDAIALQRMVDSYAEQCASGGGAKQALAEAIFAMTPLLNQALQRADALEFAARAGTPTGSATTAGLRADLEAVQRAIWEVAALQTMIDAYALGCAEDGGEALPLAEGTFAMTSVLRQLSDRAAALVDGFTSEPREVAA